MGSTVVNLLSGFAAGNGGLASGLAQLGPTLDMLGIQVGSPNVDVEVEPTVAVPSGVVVQVPQVSGPVEVTAPIAAVPSNGASYLIPAGAPQTVANDPQQVTPDSIPSGAGPQPSNIAPEVPAVDDFLEQGQAAFATRDYVRAEKAWRHAVADDTENGTLWLLHAQALFAVGDYDRSAGAVQRGMMLLAEEDWGVVVANHREIYFTDSKTNDYVTQLQALEKAAKSQPNAPALRFLLGYHYGFLGYPAQSVRELDKLIELNPRNELGRRLGEIMAQRSNSK